MTEQQYKARLRLIVDNYADNKLSLCRAFAFSGTPVKRITASSIKHTARGYYRLPWNVCGGTLLKNRRYTTEK